MIFFAPPEIFAANYTICKYNTYYKFDLSSKKMVFIDPSVNQLRKRDDYIYKNKLEELIRILPENHFISIDYPSDMDKYSTNIFIRRTRENNIKYAENPQYICTIQYRISNISEKGGRIIAKPTEEDFNSFLEEYDKIKYIVEDNPSKIFAVGNLCKMVSKNKFLDELVKFLLTKKNKLSRIHFYGMGTPLIVEYLTKLDEYFQISVDNVKWIYPTKKIRLSYSSMRYVTNEERIMYFESYIQYLRDRGVKISYQ